MNTRIFFRYHWKDLILVIFSVVIVILIMSTTCVRRDLNKAETNIKALTDTIHTYKLKNGELMYEKQGFITEKKELEKYIGIKESEVRDIEKKLKSTLATIANLKAQIITDTIHTVDSIEVLPDSVYKCHFKYNDNWLTVDGVTNIKLYPFYTHTVINNIGMEVPLKIGTTKNDQWFVTTDNPYIEFTSIEGANIEKAKSKRFSLSLQFGIGGVFGYGISGAKDGIVRTGWIIGVGGYAGLGISYKLFEF